MDLLSGSQYFIPARDPRLATELRWQAPPGTQIAIRRTLAPGEWQKKTEGSPALVRYVDSSSGNGILQRVDHEPDIWYVGVYQPLGALGSFTLTLDDIRSLVGDFDGYNAACCRSN